jgi:hypothetical protein
VCRTKQAIRQMTAGRDRDCKQRRLYSYHVNLPKLPKAITLYTWSQLGLPANVA